MDINTHSVCDFCHCLKKWQNFLIFTLPYQIILFEMLHCVLLEMQVRVLYHTNHQSSNLKVFFVCNSNYPLINALICYSEIQRTWMLKVLYSPKVNMTLGHGLDASNIHEGADVYFECHLIANPWVSLLNTDMNVLKIADKQH